MDGVDCRFLAGCSVRERGTEMLGLVIGVYRSPRDRKSGSVRTTTFLDLASERCAPRSGAGAKLRAVGRTSRLSVTILPFWRGSCIPRICSILLLLPRLLLTK
jgi:hypothetical protein